MSANGSHHSASRKGRTHFCSSMTVLCWKFIMINQAILCCWMMLHCKTIDAQWLWCVRNGCVSFHYWYLHTRYGCWTAVFAVFAVAPFHQQRALALRRLQRYVDRESGTHRSVQEHKHTQREQNSSVYSFIIVRKHINYI